MNQSKYQTDVALLSVTTTEFRAVTHFHEFPFSLPSGKILCINKWKDKNRGEKGGAHDRKTAFPGL